MSLDLHVAVRGAVIGFALAAPIGPIGVLVIRRSLEGGAASGLASGMGAAVADAIYALAGALGLASLGAHGAWVKVGGGAALVALGVRALGRTRGDRGVTSRVGHARAFAGTLLLTLTSPVSILSFAAFAASLGVGAGSGGAGGWHAAAALAFGVFAGSAAWWIVLASAVGALRRHMPERALPWVHRAGALTLVAFGALALVTP